MYINNDSLIYIIAIDDFYQDKRQMTVHFDTTDYDENDIYYGMPRVDKLLDKMKDELHGEVMCKRA